MLNRSLKYIIVSCILLIVSCGTTKRLNDGERNLNLSARQLIKENSKRVAKFKTMTARVKIDYVEGDNSKSTTVSFRMEKDKTIWMSKLGFIKAMITPDRVSFYNKLDNTYFDGDYALISDILGTELDFNKVQNLILGEAIFGLRNGDFEVFTQGEEYVLKPKLQSETLELFYLFNASHFKISSQQLAQEKESRILQVDYLDYQEVNRQVFPEHIKINAVEGYEETRVSLEFKSIALNEDLHFPFKIPSGYDEIILK